MMMMMIKSEASSVSCSAYGATTAASRRNKKACSHSCNRYNVSVSIMIYLLLRNVGPSSNYSVNGFSMTAPLSSQKQPPSSLIQLDTKYNENTQDFLTSETRQALIQTCNDYPSLYHYKGWSNRLGKLLTPIHVHSKNNNVYTADRQFTWFGIDVGGRCTIIELPSTNNDKPDLFIHSPVALDDEFQRLLESIGTVKYICSPNYEHLKYASAWYETYCNGPTPSSKTAYMWGCPGLPDKMPNIQWNGEIPYNYRPISYTSATSATTISSNQQCWDTEILQPLHLNIERNPFNGKPFFEECIFYHAPTKTLLTTDFFWNYPNKDGITNSQQGYDGSWELAPPCYQDNNDNSDNNVPLTTLLWKFGMDRIYTPFYQNFMIHDRTEYENIIHHILNVWDIETIIPCHGDIIRGKQNCQTALKSALLLSK